MRENANRPRASVYVSTPVGTMSTVYFVAFVVCLLFFVEHGDASADYLHRAGRHVCTAQQVVTRPVMRVGTYCQPVYKPYMTKCEGYKLCSRYRTIYQLSYRQLYEMQLTSETKYACCPGWEKHSDIARGCRKPVCSKPCQNYGQCIAPEKCHCRHGFKGQYCEDDINECSEGTHACGQICINNNGSYTCACHAGFVLETDRRSCKVCLTCIPEFHVMMARVEKLEQDFETLREDSRKPQVVTVTNSVGTVNDEQLQQLDRIASLSEQISLLEEKLDVCTCNENRQSFAFGKKRK